MKLIPLTQGKFAKIDDDDFEIVNKHKWFAHKRGKTFYAERRKYTGGGRKNAKTITIMMHNYIMNPPKNMLIDHIDLNGLNCQKNNMRVCSRSQNMMNRRKFKNSLSFYKGVTFDSKQNKWRSRIRVNNKSIHIGYFMSEIDAAKAYDKKAIELHGEFAHINYV